MKKTVSLLISLFFLTSLLVPVTVINKLLFVLIMFITFTDYIHLRKITTVSPFIVLGIFLTGFFTSFLSLSNVGLRNQFLLSVAVLFLIYPIVIYRIDLDGLVKLSGKWMMGITWLLVLCFFVFNNTYFLDFFRKSMSGAYGTRGFSSEETNFFFHLGTVPFLYVPFCLHFIDYLSSRKISILFYLIILFVTMFISSSRGLMVITVLSIVSIYVIKQNMTKRIFLILMSIPVGLLLFYIVITNTMVFNTSEKSNMVKIGHIESFFDNLNGINFFIGDGLAAYYYSKGIGAMTAHTEVTPVDMFRYFGFFLTPILYIVILFPFRRLKISYFRQNSIYFIIFLFYVINSFTNPIMFNSYGLLVVLWYWSKMLIVSEV